MLYIYYGVWCTCRTGPRVTLSLDLMLILHYMYLIICACDVQTQVQDPSLVPSFT